MKTLLAILAASVVMAVPAVASTVVANGSFEEGVTPDNWGLYSSIPGWTVSTGDLVEVQTGPTLGLTPHDGKNYLEMDGNKNYAIEQIVSLAKGKYALSFWYSPRMVDDTTNDVEYSLGDKVAGTVMGPSSRQGTSVGTWTHIVSTFKVKTADNFNLRFAGAGAEDSLGGLIDDVSINVAPVPVPAAGFLLLGALGGLGALKRRRNA